MRHAVAAPVLTEVRAALNELHTHFCISSSSLSLDGFLAFAAAFDLCPGYLSTDCLEGIFDKALAPTRPSSAHTSGRIRSGLTRDDFDEALCLIALAISEKQWRVEYAAEKRARYQYQYKDAEKSRAEVRVDEQVEHLVFALELDRPTAYRKRAGIKHLADPTATPTTKGQAARRLAPSPSSIDVRMAAMEFNSCAAGPIGASLAMGCTMASNGVADAPSNAAAERLRELVERTETTFGAQQPTRSHTGDRRRQVPPSCGSGRNSRQAGGIVGAKAGSAGSGGGGERSPRVPVRAAAPVGGGGLTMVPAPPPAAPGRPAGGRPTTTGAGRSPRRLRVSDTASLSMPQGAKAPMPPTSPRGERPAGAGRGGVRTPCCTPTPPSRNKENHGEMRVCLKGSLASHPRPPVPAWRWRPILPHPTLTPSSLPQLLAPTPTPGTHSWYPLLAPTPSSHS